MATKLNLRCKSSSGMQVIQNINTETTVFELKNILANMCSVDSSRLKIRSGYPPKVIDISNNSVTMSEMPFASGDTLVVEEDNSILPPSSSSNVYPSAANTSPFNDNLNSLWNAQLGQVNGILTRKVVPANNSCLFTSINCCMSEGALDLDAAPAMRDIIAGVVTSQPDLYTEAVLGKPNPDYCNWILKGESWGGAIEISILNKYYAVEIDVVDTQSGRIDRFGEDMHFVNRIFLLYDGIHYDPLIMEPLDGITPIKSIFPVSDDVLVAQALEIAAECKKSRQFTDVANFSLRCIVCNKPLKGQREAQEHATKTGHTNFGEI